MQLNNLFEDDDAVSPVIGVILMVAITVILAAVIATFVLGLGDQVGETAPQASFSFDWNGQSGSHDTLNVSHGGGGSVEAQNLYFRGTKGSYGDTTSDDLGQSWNEYDEAPDISVDYGATSKISAGQRAKIRGVGSDGEVDVVWEPRSGDTSATLKSWTGPDA